MAANILRLQQILRQSEKDSDGESGAQEQAEGKGGNGPGHEDCPIPQDVFARFQAGESEAVTEIVNAFYARVTGFLLLWTGRREIAEEIAQEAFFKLYRERERIHAPQNLLPWVFVTARRMAFREMKRLYHHHEFLVADGVLESALDDSPAKYVEAIQQEQMGRHLRTCLNRLKPVDRELIVLKYFSELKIREISDVLQMPMGTVGVKLQRALTRLRRELDAEGLRFEDLQ